MYELNPYIILYQNLFLHIQKIISDIKEILLVEQELLTLLEHLSGYVYVC
jgi:hypothetical protein